MAMFMFVVMLFGSAVIFVRIPLEAANNKKQTPEKIGSVIGFCLALGVNVWLTVWFGWFSGLLW